MAKRQTQRNSKGPRNRYWTGDIVDGKTEAFLPPSLGRGATITIKANDGTVFNHDPGAYRKLNRADRNKVVEGILAAAAA